MIKSNASFNSLAEKFVLIAVFLFPVSILLIKSAGSTIFTLLVLLSLFVFFTQSIKLEFSREEKLLFYSCLLIFLMAMLTAWIGGMDNAALKKMDGFLNLLFAVPLYFLFKSYLKKNNIIWWGLLVAVVLCGLVAIYEINYGALYGGIQGRAKAATHPILFADVALTMTMVLLIAATTIKKLNYKIISLLAIVLVLGVTAVILSKSRGAWVVLPVLIVMMMWRLKPKFSTKSFVLFVLMMPVLALVVYLLPATGLKERVDHTFSNVQKYSQGSHKGTSIGTRFEMWQASIMIFQEQPVAGVGWGNYKEAAGKLVEKGEISKSAMAWNHPHNQMLSAMTNGGALMLFAFLVFSLVPLFLFKRLLIFDDNKTQAFALSGIVLAVSYLGYGLSEAIFERSIPTTFYAFYLALFFAMATRSKEEKNQLGMQRSEKLSVIVIAYNEADRIGDCLASVADWADEIILFDNGSTDGTIDIAKKYMDKVFVTDWPGFGKQKQRALDKAQHDWVLSIDADERLTPALRTEIDTVLSSANSEIAYRIPWAVTIYNKRLDFGRSGRAPLRLFKRQGARFSDASVHEKVLLPDGKVGQLQERLLHYTHRNLNHAVRKFNDYAWLWGTERFEKGKRATWLSPITHAVWTFFVIYFLRLGLLDGFRGLVMAVHLSMYTFNKYTVLWTLEKQAKQS